jgi:hypothetical protein
MNAAARLFWNTCATLSELKSICSFYGRQPTLPVKCDAGWQFLSYFHMPYIYHVLFPCLISPAFFYASCTSCLNIISPFTSSSNQNTSLISVILYIYLLCTFISIRFLPCIGSLRVYHCWSSPALSFLLRNLHVRPIRILPFYPTAAVDRLTDKLQLAFANGVILDHILLFGPSHSTWFQAGDSMDIIYVPVIAEGNLYAFLYSGKSSSCGFHPPPQQRSNSCRGHIICTIILLF